MATTHEVDFLRRHLEELNARMEDIRQQSANAAMNTAVTLQTVVHDVRNSDHEGSTGLFVQIMTYKFGSRTEDVEDRLHEYLELVRRYDEANGTDPVPDQVKKACIISNTPEPLETHLQLNVSNLGTFDALRVATEDYLRSRRIFKTTSAGNTQEDDPVEVDVLS